MLQDMYYIYESQKKYNLTNKYEIRSHRKICNYKRKINPLCTLLEALRYIVIVFYKVLSIVLKLYHYFF